MKGDKNGILWKYGNMDIPRIKAPYTLHVFVRFSIVYCSQGNREQRSSLHETIQKRRKTFPCVRGLNVRSPANRCIKNKPLLIISTSEVQVARLRLLIGNTQEEWDGEGIAWALGILGDKLDKVESFNKHWSIQLNV